MTNLRSRTYQAVGLALVGGVLAFLGFAGFDVWPLAFVAFVPLFAAIDLEPTHRTKRVVLLSWLYGTVAIAGGYYWLVEMLESFSGFPFLLNVLIATVLFVYLAGQFALFGWLWFRTTERGFDRTLCAVLAYATAEFLFPNLFPFYYGVSLHPVPILMQTADLGGPVLVSGLVIAVNSVVYEVGKALLRRRPVPRAAPVGVAAWMVAALVYGAVRTGQVDGAIAEADKITVGMVQVNMGIFDKREEPWEGHRRHLEQTAELERDEDPDLVVWPESAYNFLLPEDVENVRRHVTGEIRTPVLFGGLARRRENGERRLYNTAYLTDADGNIQGTYDKTYLLAFGEYIPLGDTFPFLYELSPNTGHFTPGDHVRPLTLGDWRITTLICYEDILPSFVRRAVAEGDPHLLVNITNDAWFGDTTEPWIHLALAKFRAIEHRRYLVRVTNSGVSAVVDPAGRVVTHGGVFTRETLSAEVGLMRSWTPFQALDSWPGFVAVAAVLWLGFLRRPRTGQGRGARSSS
ncbi:MAG: apolipoprotein N-acyltransferase [Myxococcota bacterium]